MPSAAFSAIIPVRAGGYRPPAYYFFLEKRGFHANGKTIIRIGPVLGDARVFRRPPSGCVRGLCRGRGGGYASVDGPAGLDVRRLASGGPEDPFVVGVPNGLKDVGQTTGAGGSGVDPSGGSDGSEDASDGDSAQVPSGAQEGTGSIEGGKVIGHAGPGQLQITKLVSDYTEDSAEWLGDATGRTYTVHVAAGVLPEGSSEPMPDPAVFASLSGAIVSSSYDDATGIGTIVLQDGGYAVLSFQDGTSTGSAAGDPFCYVWEDVDGDAAGPYYDVRYSGDCVDYEGGPVPSGGVGAISADIRMDAASYVTIYNSVVPRTRFEFLKTDEYGNSLGDAYFSLEDAQGAVLGTAVSRTDTYTAFDAWLPAGTYRLVETAAPFGYYLSDPYTVKVSDEWARREDGSFSLAAVAGMYGPSDVSMVMPLAMFRNKAMTALPSTGSSGSMGVRALGASCLAAGAVTFFLAFRRHEGRDA